MKLHLPTMLRKALLACFAAVSAVTFATGSAWAGSTDLITDTAHWTMGSGAGGGNSRNTEWKDGAIYQPSGWNRGLATYAVDTPYTVGVAASAEEISFSVTWSVGGVASSAANSMQSIALVGTTQTLVLGHTEYISNGSATSIYAGLTTNTTATLYFDSSDDWGDVALGDIACPETMTAFSSSGTNVVPTTNTTYTVNGALLDDGDGTYTLNLTLESNGLSYTVTGLDVGGTFDITKVVFACDGAETTLSGIVLYDEALKPYRVTLAAGETIVSDADWTVGGESVSYAELDTTSGEAVMKISGANEGSTAVFADSVNVDTIMVQSGIVSLKLEDGVSLKASNVSGIAGIQMDNGETATIGGGSISASGPILTSGSTAQLQIEDAALNLSGNSDMYGTVRMIGSNTLTGGRLTITDGSTLELADGASFTRTGSVAYWLQGTITTLENAEATFTASDDIHFDYKQNNTVSATGRIVAAQGSTLNLNVGSHLVGYDEAVIEVAEDAIVNYSGGMRGTLKFVGPGSMNFSNLAFGDLTGNNAPETTATFAEGIQVTAERLCSANGTHTINVTGGAGVTVTGSNNSNSNQASFLLAHWGHDATLKIDGGELTSQNAIMRTSFSGTGAVSIINNGVATLKGITFLAQNNVKKGSLVLGAAEGGDATLKIGDAGIQDVSGDNVTVTLGNGTIEAMADWAMTGDGSVNLVGATGTKFDTGTYTVKIAPTLSGTGKLIKTGSGTLEINAASTLASLDVQQGDVQAGAALTIGALSMASTDAGMSFNTLALDAAAESALVTASGYADSLTLKLIGGKAGTFKLFQGDNALTQDKVNVLSADRRLNIDAVSVVNGLVSVTASLLEGGNELTWDVDGPSNVWNTQGKETNWDNASGDTVFYNDDVVTFAGEGEEITISGDVAPATVTVSGKDYSFAGTGKITGDASLSVENGGVLEIKSAQRYTGGTTVKSGGELILSTGGGDGALNGGIDVYGKLTINAGDITGWSQTNGIKELNVYEGGEMHVAVSTNDNKNQTGAGLAVNLTGGSLTGVAGSNLDLGYGGATYGYSSINALAAAGATAASPTESTISDVKISLRQRLTTFEVQENARLTISSVIAGKTDYLNSEPANDAGGTAIDPTFTKSGAGELVLSGANTYTYKTVVEAGTLTLADGGVLDSVVTVDDGATFKLEDGATYRAASIGGSGSVVKVGSGVATLTAATTLSSLDIQEGFVQTGADTATVSTLTVADGAGFVYDLALGQKKVVAESFDGPITLKLLSLADGTFELLQGAAGLDASDVTFECNAGSRVTAKGSVENGLAKVTVEFAENNLDNLIWNTGHENDTWSVGGAINWTSDGAAETFLNGDSVTFAGTGETISIAGSVQPASIVVDGTGYIFEGTGSIGGTGSLMVKSGSQLSISTSNSYTGGTTIEEGAVLTITNALALGVGNAENNRVVGTVSGNGKLVVDTTATITSANTTGFYGTVEAMRGEFTLDSFSENTAESISKVVMHSGSRLQFGSTNYLKADIDLMAGSELYGFVGTIKGNVRFNVAEDGTSYDSAGEVVTNSYWGNTISFEGLVEGDGMVKFNSAVWFRCAYKLLNDANTFAGTYNLTPSPNNWQPSNFPYDRSTLVLGAQNAAQYATINLDGTATNGSLLMLDSNATVKKLTTTLASSADIVKSSIVATLTLTEGDFGGSIQNGSDANVLSLTKQGAADTTLILRGANTYTGATTINGGTLELAAGAELASELVTVQGGAVLAVNEGTYASTYVDGSGTLVKRGEMLGDYVHLAGLAESFAGTIDVQGGNLYLGDTLEIKNGRTLKAGANGVYLNNALTLSGGKLALDYTTAADAEATMLNLSENALTLHTGNTLILSGLVLADTSTQANTIDLLTGVGEVLGSDGNALDLTGALASTYFSTIEGLGTDIDTSTLGLQLADGNLQLVVPVQENYLVWGEGTGTWATDADFTADDADFTTDANVQFGALTAGESDTVSISGAVSTGKVLIDAGEGKTYIFSAADNASGIASATSITINSGTASFGAGTLDMTADTTLTVNDGGTLSLANGAIADASKVGIELNDGSTLSFANNHADTFAAKITVADGATVNLVNNNVNVGMTLTNVAQGEGETATFNLSGANFSMDSEDLHGTVNIGTRADGTTPVNVNLIGSSTAFDQNFTGVGSVTVVKDSTARLSGTNTYSGQTIINGNLIVLGSQALSDNTTMAGGSKVYLATAADGSNGEYTINRDFVSGASNIAVYVGLNADDISGTDAVSGVKLTLGADAFLKSSIFVRSGNELIVADGADINDGQQYNVESGASMTLQGAVADTVAGAGTVKIDGDITWNNANKTYTGETQVLAGSTLTAAAPLTSGAGKVQVMEDGAMIITNSADWANKVYGAGTLVLVNGVDNLDAIVDGAATDTLSTAYVGMPVQTFGTTDVDGVLSIDDAAAAASAAKITDLVVNAGSSVNVSTTGGSLKIGQNLSLSGAGDAAATAGTAEAAALAITTGSGETKISSNITLAADTTIYAGGTGDHRLNGSFNGAGYTLTKTGSGFLDLGEFASGSTNDLSGDLNIQGGTVQLVAMGTADARQAIGKTTMAAGTKLYFYSGDYNFADADGALQIDGDATLDLGAASTANLGTAVTGSSTVTLASSGANSTGTLTLSADNDFSGTWKFNTAAWKMNLAHADAAKNATVDMNASGVLRLMDAAADYNIAALKGSVATATDKGVQTESATRHGLIITNTLTDAANATYAGAVAGTVDVKLLGGMQKFNGALGDGSTYTVSAGTLSIASTGQSGTHSYTATGGVLDMTGYTRVDAATGADTIYAVGGRVNGLNLGAGMTLADALADGSAEATGAVTLGGNTVLGAGTMNFRVTDSTNTIPGTSDPYKLTDTLYQVGEETGDAISLAGSGAKTLLNISLNAPVEILDPTEENAGDGYRDHTLISGLTLADASAAAGDFFASNLDNVQGSTSYSLHFVQNAGNSALYDLVLRAMGAADTLFWNNVAGGTWEAADQTTDSWVQAQTVDGVLTPGTTTADFEQMDYVVFGDLTDAMGTAVTDVTITVADAGVQIGNMTVQGDTTNYTFEGGKIDSVDGNTGATLTKTGASTLTLKGANGYDGVTTITGGTVIAQNKAALSTTAATVSNGALLVLDYAAATDADKALAAEKVTLTGATLRAQQSANATLGALTADSHLQAVEGATLTVTPTADGTGYLYINKAAEGYTGTALTGTVQMNLSNYGTYVQNGISVDVAAGKLVLNGTANDVFKTNSLTVAEGATIQVAGGMTASANGFGSTAGTIELKDASKLEYRDNAGGAVAPKIVSEGGTLQMDAAAVNNNAVLTIGQGGLTVKGTGTDAAADTTLKGGTWVLNTGAVAWDSAATGALALGANTTVKVNDDTLKNVKVNASNAVLTTAKADAAALSVETITVGNGGKVQDVNLTITGTGSKIQGAVAGVTVNQAGTVDLAGTPALTFASAAAGNALRATLGSLDILSGRVQVPALANPVVVNSGAVTINGANAMLDLSAANKLTKADGTTAVDITINAGGIQGAQTYNGLITVNDKGTVLADGITLKNLSNAATVKLEALTANDTAMTTLKGMQGMTLADGATIALSTMLEEGQGNLLFDFADNPTGTLKLANGAKLTIDVNDVLGDVLNAATGSVTYTLADADATGLAAGTVFDAALKLYNLEAAFTTDGNLVLSRTSTPLDDDAIYRSSEDNVGADGTQWAGNGPDVYSSSEPYASVYIDKDTVIDLTDAAPTADQAENGLVLSNLIGRGNGANLTIEGDGNDLVTINNNLDPSDVDKNLRSLSFNGDIDVTGTELQLKNTVATPGAEAGELDSDSVYQINGALTTDEDSMVTITAGILKLNGKGSNASELLGGVTVENGMGQLQVSGEATLGGTLQVSDEQGLSDRTGDLELLSGGKVTLLDGTVVDNGFDILGAGEGKEVLSVAKDATATLSQASYVEDVVLDLQNGSTLVMNTDENTNKYGHAVEVDGLTGTGALQGTSSAAGYWPHVYITPQQDCTFSGDLSGYDGFIHVNSGKGSQTFDKVTTATDSAVELDLAGKSVINVAEENGNKTLNLRLLKLLDGSDTTVEMNTDSGTPAIRINGSSAAMGDGAALTLSSAVGKMLSADDDLLFMEGVGNADVARMDGKSITLDITDEAFRRLNETAKLVVDGDKVYVDLTASETNRYEDAASDPNAKAGAELLWNVDPSKLPADSALKAVDSAVASLLQAGNREEAERVMAATAGAGTAVLGSAFSADVERQLRAIRNRTTTMGVNQCEVNEGMPYVNAWINAEGDHREMDADGLAAGYTMDSWGGTVGFDVDITNNLTMGMAVTAMYGDLEADSADRAEGDFDTQYVSLFARVAHQAWTHTFVATLGRADVTLNRTVSVPGGSYETDGETDGLAYGFMYEVARTFSLSEDGSTCWQPVFNVAWRHSSIDGYTESGADNALAVGEQDMNVLTFGAGARLQTVMGESLYNRASIFEARAMVKVDAGDREGEADVALLEGTTSASVKSAEIGAVGVEIGAGVTIPVGLNAGSIFIDGSAEFRSGYSNVNGTVGYRINF